ncbi:hypothetical protein KP509_11G031800 [Ceratopteris richardii]|uniref:Protein kinase domain-containing protein n=1 Tax=Ceratopteris richardii TaxID=49495 RepID=A0A8T2TU60_CERRI|nr:hypothetical protein KP509_11G031800 [Ceratopteris richardii]
MSVSILTLLFVVSLHLWPILEFSTAQAGVFFSYPNDDSAHFLLLGDAVLIHDLVELTSSRDPEAVGGSSGRFLCRTPVRMVDPETGQAASFKTSFTFRMYSFNSSYQGDGMAFLMVSDNHTIGSSGKQLGAFTAESSSPNDHTFAVEFDTWQNSDVGDPNDNHVGLDVTNITSATFSNASDVGIRLNDGSVVTAWIKYDAALHNLQVRISLDNLEPLQPLIDANLSLGSIFNEYMYVGFSGSTGLSNEAHTLMSWTFSSWGLNDPSLPSAMKVSPSNAKNGATVALTVCLILVLVILVFGLLSWKMTASQLCGENYFRRTNYYDSKLSLCSSPRSFTYKELHTATRGFHEKQKLGNGSCYKGVLADSGSVVAVKQVSKDANNGLEEFLREVRLLTSTPHQNLVPLRGWCLEKGEFLVVYEFITNESLDKYLFNAHTDVLSWSQRYHIISGLAGGLAHMHEGLQSEGDGREPPHATESITLIHRNVKPSNVMLDDNFNARLGDYGFRRLARSRHKGDHAMILEGTFGYIAPEVVGTGKVTTKADVFSFGILVLEVACGRKAINNDDVLLDTVWELERRGRILGAADERLKGCFDVKEMECLLYLGLHCTLPDPWLRPSMSQIHRILLGDCPLPALPPSKQHSPPLMAPLDRPDRIRASLHISIDDLLAS